MTGPWMAAAPACKPDREMWWRLETKAWHCNACEVDWISVSRACWICEHQGQPGRLGITSVLPK